MPDSPRPATLDEATISDLLAELRSRGVVAFIVSRHHPQPGWDWSAYPGGWEAWLDERAESLENDICRFIDETLDERACNSGVPWKDED